MLIQQFQSRSVVNRKLRGRYNEEIFFKELYELQPGINEW